MKKLVALIALVFSLSGTAFAGDVATLVNLGFSPDSAYFMFGFHGLDTAAGKPYAEIYVVNTKKNEFVPNGTFRGLYAVTLEPGWNPAGAFFKLFSEASPVARSYKIDHLAQGRLVYLLTDGIDGPDTLSFKDFKTSAQWDVVLKETVEEKDGTYISSFGLELAVTGADGKKLTLKAGNPLIRRKGVSNYTISQIIVAPDGKTVVVLIEKVEKSPAGLAIRWMVETLKLP